MKSSNKGSRKAHSISAGSQAEPGGPAPGRTSASAARYAHVPRTASPAELAPPGPASASSALELDALTRAVMRPDLFAESVQHHATGPQDMPGDSRPMQPVDETHIPLRTLAPEQDPVPAQTPSEQARHGRMEDEHREVTPLLEGEIDSLFSAPENNPEDNPPAPAVPTTSVDISPVDISPLRSGELAEPGLNNSTPPSPAPTEQRSEASPRPASFLRRTDFAYSVGQFQNSSYLAHERQPANLPQFRKSVENLQPGFQNPGIPRETQAELTRLTEDLLSKIDRVATDRTMGYRSAAMLAFGIVNIGLALLPTLTAAKNEDNQYLSLLVAGYAKTMLMLVGLALSKTADATSYTQHIKERHVPYLPPNLPYAISAFNSNVKAFETEHPILFHSAAAAFTASVFVLTSAPHLVTKPLESAYQAIKNYVTQPPSGESGPMPPSEELKTEIDHLMEAVRTQQSAFLERREAFEQSGGQLSDSLNVQLSEIDSAMASLDAAMNKLLQKETEGSENQTNKDFAQKMAFVVIAAAVCSGAAATYYNEPAGLVDLGMDTGLVMYELAKTALDPSENAQQAAGKFSSYSGLSPLLLPYGIINKLPSTHFTDNTLGLIMGTLFLTCCNLTLPRLGGKAIANGIINLLNAMRNRSNEPDIERGVEQLRDSGRFTEITEETPREIEMAPPPVRESGESSRPPADEPASEQKAMPGRDEHR